MMRVTDEERRAWEEAVRMMKALECKEQTTARVRCPSCGEWLRVTVEEGE